MQEKSQNLSEKQGKESMIWDKMSCINGWMVKFNLVISLLPYPLHRIGFIFQNMGGSDGPAWVWAVADADHV